MYEFLLDEVLNFFEIGFVWYVFGEASWFGFYEASFFLSFPLSFN